MAAVAVESAYPDGQYDMPETAPLGAVFSLEIPPHLQLVDESYSPEPPRILEALLALPEDVDTVVELNEYVKGLLNGERDKHYRNQLAADYGDHYRSELDIDDSALDHDQLVALLQARLYFSSLSSLGHLGLFIGTAKAMGRQSEEFEAGKLKYLAARKVYQDDVDEFLDYLEEHPEDELLSTLTEISNLTRLAVKETDFVDHETHEHTHIFVGSVLSERLIKISMQEFIDPAVRYADEHEEPREPIGRGADVMWPREKWDMPVQVKMKWKTPKPMKIEPKKKPPHVTIPLPNLRTDLTEEEHSRLADILPAVAERLTFQHKVDEALAMGGLRKYFAVCRVYASEYRYHWSIFKAKVMEGEEPTPTALQTEVSPV